MVDDHGAFRRQLRRLLESGGELAVVGEARDGLEGLELARSSSPEVVVMDVSMPVMDGIEATRLMKQEIPGVKVILISALYARAEGRPAAEHAGASLFMEKARISDELVSAIRRVCGLA
ncbi:MAG TPA: response regulator transcription factor [Dehalococcoidia bacterium]|nr:response regulator transcription factor [Dehalococcoidia bacterium]